MLYRINWNDFTISFPACLTLAVMLFTSNISYGIVFGLISHIIISFFCSNARKNKGSFRVVTLLFVAMPLTP